MGVAVQDTKTALHPSSVTPAAVSSGGGEVSRLLPTPTALPTTVKGHGPHGRSTPAVSDQPRNKSLVFRPSLYGILTST